MEFNIIKKEKREKKSILQKVQVTPAWAGCNRLEAGIFAQSQLKSRPALALFQHESRRIQKKKKE